MDGNDVKAILEVMSEGFASMNERFDKQDKRLDLIDRRLTRVEMDVADLKTDVAEIKGILEDNAEDNKRFEETTKEVR